MKKQLAAVGLSLTLLTVPAAAFSDVDGGLYYAAPIAWAVEEGITSGTSEDTFSPNVICTQGQILTFLWRAAGSPYAAEEFLPGALAEQTLNSDFQKAIAWAYQTGILRGGDPVIDPYAPCSRGIVMRLLWSYAGSPVSGASCAFTDVDPDSDYAQAVAWAVDTGITSGTSETTFSPNESCTRGQIATFLYRCLNQSAGMENADIPESLPPEPPEPEAEEVEEETRPLRTYAASGRACSLGLDGSDFTVDSVYEAQATVYVYSPYEALFTVEVPFPLYQACNYTVFFKDAEFPERGYTFSFLRWDEAFADMIPWEGGNYDLRFTDISDPSSSFTVDYESTEDDRIGGIIIRRVTLPQDGEFNFSMLDGCEIGCDVNSNL